MNRQSSVQWSALFVFSMLLFLTFFGCIPRSLSPAMPENQEQELSNVIKELEKLAPREEKPVVVGVGGSPLALFAWDLEKGTLIWSRQIKPLSAPMVVGNLVVIQTNEDVVALSLESGEEVLALDAKGDLVGADSDGRLTAISVSGGPNGKSRSLVFGIEGDSIKWTRKMSLPVGIPAVAGNLVFVPWATQRVSILEGRTGDEKIRFIVKDDVVGHAFVDKTSVYLGQHGLFRVTASMEKGTRKEAAYYKPVGRPMPAQPLMMRDGYQTAPAPDDAWHSARLIWRPGGEGEEVKLEDDVLYLLYYRYLFAFDPDADEVRWVYHNKEDMVGAAAAGSGLLLASTKGEIFYVDAKTGGRVWEADVGTPIMAAHIRPGTFVPKPAETAPKKDLAEQLYEAARLDDPRLAAGKSLAIRYLDHLPDDSVTARLIELCTDRSGMEPSRQAACQAVAKRKTGISHVKKALRKHASFLEERSVPPVGALAKAAANMEARSEVPHLLKHLADPATPSQELPGLIDGLAALGSSSAAKPIEEFLLLYHAEAKDKDLIAALISAVNGLKKLKGRGALPVIKSVAEDPLTADSLAKAAKAAADALEPVEEKKGDKKGEKADEPKKDNRAPRITGDMVQTLVKPILKELRQCLPEKIAKARITLLVRPKGDIKSIVVSPKETEACIEKILSKKRFPETRNEAGQQVVYILNREQVE